MQERIQADLRQAMKAGDKTTVSVLRMLLSALKYASIEEKRDLKEEEFASLVQKSVRSRKESIEAFRKGGRGELVERAEAELKGPERYLPAQMAGVELEQAAARLLSELGFPETEDLV